MSDQRPLVLKVGGSILTARDQACVEDERYLGQLAEEIRPFVGRIAVVHGMGSVGRALLPLYSGRSIEVQRAVLARDLQRRMRALHYRVVDRFTAAGLRVRSFDPEAIFALAEARCVRAELGLVAYAMESGQLPVLHGGTVPELDGGFTIFSSDTIAGLLACRLGAARIVWATDVEGVFALGGGEDKIIRRLDRAARHRVARLAYDEKDATGGMTGKLEIAYDLAARGVSSHIVCGCTPGAVASALAGSSSAGTLVPAERAA